MAALCAWRALGEPVHFRLQLLLKQRVCSAIHAIAAALFDVLRTKQTDSVLLRNRLAIRFATQKRLPMLSGIAPAAAAACKHVPVSCVVRVLSPLCTLSREPYCCRYQYQPYQQLRLPDHRLCAGWQLCNELLWFERERRIPAAAGWKQLGGRSGVGFIRWQSEQCASRFTNSTDGLASRAHCSCVS